jgi:hypothetical protein
MITYYAKIEAKPKPENRYFETIDTAFVDFFVLDSSPESALDSIKIYLTTYCWSLIEVIQMPIPNTREQLRHSKPLLRAAWERTQSLRIDAIFAAAPKPGSKGEIGKIERMRP